MESGLNNNERNYKTWDDFRHAPYVRFYFRAGYQEVRAGKRLDYKSLDCMGISAAKHYELGRHWATELPKAGAWKIAGKPPVALKRLMYPQEMRSSGE